MPRMCTCTLGCWARGCDGWRDRANRSLHALSLGISFPMVNLDVLVECSSAPRFSPAWAPFIQSVMDSWLKGELIPRDRIDEDQGKVLRCARCARCGCPAAAVPAGCCRLLRTLAVAGVILTAHMG